MRRGTGPLTPAEAHTPDASDKKELPSSSWDSVTPRKPRQHQLRAEYRLPIGCGGMNGTILLLTI